MLDLTTPQRNPATLDARIRSATVPSCSTHPGSTVRRYRTHGPNGPGIYPQCLAANGDQPHLLAWPTRQTFVRAGDARDLSDSELGILNDAAEGMTTNDSALRRHKGLQTVKTQRRSILLKLGARNMVQAVSVATREQLIGATHAS